MAPPKILNSPRGELPGLHLKPCGERNPVVVIKQYTVAAPRVEPSKLGQHPFMLLILVGCLAPRAGA